MTDQIGPPILPVLGNVCSTQVITYGLTVMGPENLSMVGEYLSYGSSVINQSACMNHYLK